MASTKVNIDFTRCKSFGHYWDDAVSPPGMPRVEAGYGRLYFRCSRCGTEKYYNIWLATGEGRPTYRYPDHYSDNKDTRRGWKIAFYRQYRRSHASN